MSTLSSSTTLSTLYQSYPLTVQLLVAYACIICAIFIFRSRISSVPFANAVLKSRLRDEFSYSSKPVPNQPFKVLSLWIYPVKGCRGIELNKSEVVETGLKYDRQLMFATRKSPSDIWTFASQRGHPQMALLHTSINPTKNTLTISYPIDLKSPSKRRSFTVPLDANISKQKYPVNNVQVWSSQLDAYDLSAHIPTECKETIWPKLDVGLYSMINGNERLVYGKYCDRYERRPRTGFADAFPIHILSLSSVRELNGRQRVKDEVPELTIRRFRPNVIVGNTPAYDEDNWSVIKIGQQRYNIVARTPRCKVPNNDPDTAERSRNEPDVTIRHERDIDEGGKLMGKGCMGMQMAPTVFDGTMYLDDEIIVESRTDEHCYG